MRHFVFLAFINMAASDLQALQAVLFLPPERLGEVRRRSISCTPIPSLLGGLLSKNEDGQLALCLRPPLKQWERCLRLSKNRGHHRFGRLTRPELLLHLQGETIYSPTWPTSLRASPFSCEQRKPFWPTHHGPEQVSWHSLAGHFPLPRPYRRWKPLWWDFSDPPPLPFLLLCL